MPVQVWTPGLGGTVGTTRTTPPGPSSIQTRSDDLEPDKRAPVPTTVSPLRSVETDRRAGHVRGPRGPSYRSEPVAATEY